jgi:HSP20 family protein
MAHDDLIRLMQSLFLPAADSYRDVTWQPPMDLYRTRTGWLLKLDLAGVRPDDIRVTVQGRRLSIRGMRRDWVREEECSCYQMEIAYSRFERTLELPCNLERARIETEYHYGLLLVRIQTETEQ